MIVECIHSYDTLEVQQPRYRGDSFVIRTVTGGVAHPGLFFERPDAIRLIFALIRTLFTVRGRTND